MSTQEKHTAKSKTKKAVAASASAVPPSVYPTEHPKIELDRDLLGYDENGSALAGEELLVDELAAATTEAVKEAGKASRKAIKKVGKKAGEAIDAELADDTHQNPMSNAIKTVLSRLRGKGKRYGNSKEGFSRFVKANRKSIVGIALLICSVIVVLTATVWYVINDNKYLIEGSAVQYYAGQAYPVADGTVLTRGLDDTTTMSVASGEYSLSSLVIYQEDSDTIILPQNMILYTPRSDEYVCVEALSTVTANGLYVSVTTDKQSTQISPGFLYDGADYYVFLEDVTVYYNHYSMELSPLSYIEAIYENYLIIFDYETKESVIQEITTEITVVPSDESYTLLLINDLIEYGNEDKSLLFSRPDLLDTIFE